MRLLALLALALPLAGCTLVQEPTPRELAGPTDGYTPTATYLKVHLVREDGSVAMLDFDRRDWYTAGIAKQLDRRQIDFVVAQATPRDILNEYVADSVASPDTLRGLRYDEMDATPEQRAEMQREHDALVEAFLATAPPAADAPAPDIALPLA